MRKTYVLHVCYTFEFFLKKNYTKLTILAIKTYIDNAFLTELTWHCLKD